MAEIASIIQHGVLHNDFSALRVLWRQSAGNQAKAYEIIRATMAHYTKAEITDFDITLALAMVNGGCEVEWES